MVMMHLLIGRKYGECGYYRTGRLCARCVSCFICECLPPRKLLRGQDRPREVPDVRGRSDGRSGPPRGVAALRQRIRPRSIPAGNATIAIAALVAVALVYLVAYLAVPRRAVDDD